MKKLALIFLVLFTLGIVPAYAGDTQVHVFENSKGQKFVPLEEFEAMVKSFQGYYQNSQLMLEILKTQVGQLQADRQACDKYIAEHPGV